MIDVTVVRILRSWTEVKGKGYVRQINNRVELSYHLCID